MDEKASLAKKYAAVIKKVKEVLENKEIVNSILAQYPKREEKTVDEAITENLQICRKLQLVFPLHL